MKSTIVLSTVSSNVANTVSKSKRGPATEAGRRRISESRLKTGMRSNAVKADKQACRELIKSTQAVIDEFNRRSELMDRALAGDSQALIEMGDIVIGNDEAG